MDRNMKQGIWDKIPGRALRECTLGVIGVGDVGKTVVRRALGFGMRILGNDIIEMPEEFLTETNIEMVTHMVIVPIYWPGIGVDESDILYPSY